MPLSTKPDVTPEDLLEFRPLFSKIFQEVLPYHSLHFYFPDRPQSALSWREGESLEEVLKSRWVSHREMHYDPERKRLYFPLSFHHQDLGYLVFFGFQKTPGAVEKRLLKKLADLSLEMVFLKKQVQLDPVTGFFHETAFRKALARVVKAALQERGWRTREQLSLAQEQDPRQWILGFLSFSSKDQGAWSDDRISEPVSVTWLKVLRNRFPVGTILAAVRHHPLIIGFVLREGEEEGGTLLPSLIATLSRESPFTFHMGWAALTWWDQESFPGNPSPFVLMSSWWDQAWTALVAAQGLGKNQALGYREILFRAGRVMDLLPAHRIVINLGEKAGVRYHMRFSISEEGQEDRTKGMAVPLDIQDEITIAEVIHLEEAGSSPRKNDAVRLVSSRPPLPEAVPGDAVYPEGPLRSFQMFQQKLRQALPHQETFSLIIGRLDDYAERLKVWGEQGLAEIWKEMQSLLLEMLPPQGILGPYGRDGFILFFPERGGEEAKVWAERLIERFRTKLHLSLSVGVADYPCGPFHKGEILENLIKTLDHLAFLPSGSLVVFDSVTLNISGDKAYNRGDLEEALREYERALLLDPRNLNALNSLGVAYAQQGKLEAAVEVFERVLHHSPEDFMASFNLGFALAKLGREEEALSIWEALAERSKPDFDLCYHLGRLYRERKEYRKAYRWYQRAEDSPNKKGVIYRALGELEELLGKGKEAMTWYKKALKMNPHHAFCLNRLGELYLEQGESMRVALSLCQQAVRLEPGKGPYWLTLGKALLANAYPEKALEAFHKAWERQAPLKETFRGLGLTCRALGRTEEARDFFIRALKQDPEDPDLRGFLKEETEGLAPMKG